MLATSFRSTVTVSVIVFSRTFPVREVNHPELLWGFNRIFLFHVCGYIRSLKKVYNGLLFSVGFGDDGELDAVAEAAVAADRAEVLQHVFESPFPILPLPIL